MAFDKTQIAAANIDLATKDLLLKLALYVDSLATGAGVTAVSARVTTLEGQVQTPSTGLLDRATAVEAEIDGARFAITAPVDGDLLKYNAVADKFVNLPA